MANSKHLTFANLGCVFDAHEDVHEVATSKFPKHKTQFTTCKPGYVLRKSTKTFWQTLGKINIWNPKTWRLGWFKWFSGFQFGEFLGSKCYKLLGWNQCDSVSCFKKKRKGRGPFETFFLLRGISPNISCTQNGGSHLYKLYGYGLCNGKPTPK